MELQYRLCTINIVRGHESQRDTYGLAVELSGQAWGRVRTLNAYLDQPEAPRFCNDEVPASGGPSYSFEFRGHAILHLGHV